MNEKRIGAILGFVYTGLQSVISILYIPLLLTGIGKSEYGIYQIAGSVIAYFSAVEAPLSASVLCIVYCMKHRELCNIWYISCD